MAGLSGLNVLGLETALGSVLVDLFTWDEQAARKRQMMIKNFILQGNNSFNHFSDSGL